MKKAPIYLLTALLLSGCRARGGDISSVTTVIHHPSALYSQSEIEDAFRTVKQEFAREYSGCTLDQIVYSEESPDEMEEWADQYKADEAIVLYSTFHTDKDGGWSGTLPADTTYEDWKWVLVRSQGTSWRYATAGYG